MSSSFPFSHSLHFPVLTLIRPPISTPSLLSLATLSFSTHSLFSLFLSLSLPSSQMRQTWAVNDQELAKIHLMQDCQVEPSVIVIVAVVLIIFTCHDRLFYQSYSLCYTPALTTHSTTTHHTPRIHAQQQRERLFHQCNLTLDQINQQHDLEVHTKQNKRTKQANETNTQTNELTSKQTNERANKRTREIERAGVFIS